jgi:uncharacterized protein (DUF697 family)
MSLFESTAHESLHEWELPNETNESFEAFETFESFESFESQEMQELESALAQELLEITNEAQLEQFLGKLVRSVGRAASGIIKSPIGRALGGVLKNVAKTALPMVGSAIGSFVAPGIGTALGGKLGSMASNLLEVHELESMNEAEAEFEAARRYVQWARATSPNAVVRAAAVSSARRHAPTLLRPARTQQWRARRPGRGFPVGVPFGGASVDSWAGASAPGDWDATDSAPMSSDSSGRWVRRGSQIVLFNV